MSTAAIEPQSAEERPSRPEGREVTGDNVVRAACSSLFAVGLVARIAPFFDHGGRLLAQFPTEDGYYMLTMARNLALGNGLSVAGGVTPTNGTQPLATFLWGFAYSLVGADPVAGVAAVLAIEVALSLLTAYGIYRLAARLFAPRADRNALAGLAATLWFASPTFLPHTMNCLETGLYATFAVYVALAFVEPHEGAPPVMSVRRALALGVLLGGAFWARNDAVFLILGVCLAHLFGGADGGRSVVVARFLRTLVFGATSVVVALPWMAFNYLRFGHPMPVSGRAESLFAVIGNNIAHVPANLVELLLVVVPVPHAIEIHPAVVVGGSIVVFVALVLLLVRVRYASRPVRHMALMIGIWAFCLTAFYGLFFGAPWFVGRYLAPVSPFAAILGAYAMKALVERFTSSRWVLAVPLAGAFAVSLALNVRTYLGGDTHMHFQVVSWVRDNVPDETWIAAVQTGTVGYFHERTINLDGKVNPAAYEALAHGDIHEYLIGTEAEYMVDWVGAVTWMNEPEMKEAFEILVEDHATNLGVLRRIHR